MDIRGIIEQTRVLTLAAKEVLPVELGTEITHQIGHVRDAQVLGGIGHVGARHRLAHVTQVLPGAVGIEIEQGTYIALQFQFHAFGAYRSEVAIARHRGDNVGRKANHVVQLVQIAREFHFQQSAVVLHVAVHHAQVYASGTLWLQGWRCQDGKTVTYEFLASGDAHLRVERGLHHPVVGEPVAQGVAEAEVVLRDIHGLRFADAEGVDAARGRREIEMLQGKGILETAAKETQVIRQARGQGVHLTGEVGTEAQRLIHQRIAWVH